MFDIGWSEMAIILLVALIVIGPKDLPRVARTMGQWAGKGRAMAREFQTALEDMAREAELDKVKEEIEKAGRTNVGKTIEKTIDPSGELSKAFDPTAGSGKRAGEKPGDASAAKGSDAPAAKPSPAKPSPVRPGPEVAAPEPAPASSSSANSSAAANSSSANSSSAKASRAKASGGKASPAKASPAKASVGKAAPAKSSAAKPSPAKPSPAKPSPAKPSPAKPSPAKPSPGNSSENRERPKVASSERTPPLRETAPAEPS